MNNFKALLGNGPTVTIGLYIHEDCTLDMILVPINLEGTPVRTEVALTKVKDISEIPAFISLGDNGNTATPGTFTGSIEQCKQVILFAENKLSNVLDQNPLWAQADANKLASIEKYNWQIVDSLVVVSTESA